MPTKTKPKVIRDDLHGYIPLTRVEVSFLGQPEFHRLHFVGQNGLAFDTYPSLRHSRFLHSLGAMHLVGRILLSAVRKDEVTGKKFVDEFTSYCKNEHATLLAAYKSIAEDEPLFRDLGIDDSLSLCVMFQVVRIATLLHDIGHPPFSHTVERGLELIGKTVESDLDIQQFEPKEFKDFLNVRKDLVDDYPETTVLHEQVGQRLFARSMIPGLTGSLDSDAQQVVDLAVKVFVTHTKKPPILQTLKDIVDGELDCDRLDYVARDADGAGVEFGGFDRDRIVDSMAVHEVCGRYYIRPLLSALGAVEGFYQERLRLYRWIIFHHSCIRSDLALQRTTAWLMRLYDGSPRFAKKERRCLVGRVGEFERLWAYEDYGACDDNWYFAFLASFLGSIEELVDRGTLPRSEWSDALVALYSYGSEARWRCKHLESLWKRIDQYREFCSGVLAGAEIPQRAESSEVAIANRWLREELVSAETIGGLNAYEWVEGKLEDQFGSGFALEVMSWNPVGVERYDPKEDAVDALGAFLVDPELEGEEALVPLGSLSSVPEAITLAWSESIQLRGYSLDWVGADEVGPPLRKLGEALGQVLQSDEFEAAKQEGFRGNP